MLTYSSFCKLISIMYLFLVVSVNFEALKDLSRMAKSSLLDLLTFLTKVKKQRLLKIEKMLL